MFEPYSYFFYLLAYFILYSFVGWLIDSGYKSYSYKKWTNGGFMYGPRCPIYGFPVVLMTIFVYYFREHIFIFFLVATILLTMWEYFIGLTLEKIFHRKFWDYSDEKLNYKGRICFKASITWGILSVLFVLFIYDPISNMIISIPLNTLIGIIAILYAILITDFVISLTKHIKNRMKNFYEKHKDSIDEAIEVRKNQRLKKEKN